MLIRNPLSYPSGIRPAINWNHPASQGITRNRGISVVSLGGNLVSLHNGAPAALTSTYCSPTILPIIGQAAGVPTFNGSAYSFPNQVTTAAPAQTAAMIMQLNGITNGNVFMEWATNTQMILYTGIYFYLFLNGTLYNTGLAPQTGVPYFIIQSVYSSVVANITITNMVTGSTFKYTTTPTSTATPLGTVWFCNQPGLNTPMQGWIAAAMWAPTYLTMNQCLAWSQAPWDFWYPPTIQNSIFSTIKYFLTGRGGLVFQNATIKNLYGHT